jgi:beta-lactam-binding protein with PASTA domain
LDNKAFKKGLIHFLRQVGAGFVAILLGYVILVKGFGGCAGTERPEAVVPDVIGQSLEEAEALIVERNLKMENAGEAKESSLPAGYIVSQDPEPGASVKEGRTIKVRVSAGLGKIHMPNLVGNTLLQAERIIKKNGLVLGEVTEVHDDTVPADHIIEQLPAAHEKVNRGTKVSLMVSLGSEEATVLMPVNLIGMTVDEAAGALREYELAVGNVSSEPSTTVSEGRILRQSPELGENVKKGDTIDIVISSGPPEGGF